MPEINDTESHFDPAIQTEDIAFKRSELVNCHACGRANPPNRAACVYCGKAIEVADISAIKPSLRRPEDWESGWNVILLPNLNDPRPNVAFLSPILGTNAEGLNALIDAAVPIPIARLAIESEAAAVATKLAGLGIDCRIVGDAELDADLPPRRLRRIDIRAGALVLHDFNTEATETVAQQDLLLLVTGTLFSSRTDLLEKKRRRGKETKVLDETTVSSDETVLDIYSQQASRGWRIHLTGFDFSCLGDDKGLLAAENLRRLITVLSDLAPNAKVVTDYSRVANALEAVWPVESRKEPLGLKRSGFAKREFGSVASTSNVLQFTRYSRLQWHLL